MSSDSESSEDKSSKSSNSSSSEDTKKDTKKASAPAPTPTTGALKEHVKAYMKIDDVMREKREELKELNEKKLEHEEYIVKYLEKEKKDKIETADGDIIYKQTSTKTPIKEAIIEKAIVTKMKTVGTTQQKDGYAKLAHDILEEVDGMREVKVRNNIKRQKKKQAKKK